MTKPRYGNGDSEEAFSDWLRNEPELDSAQHCLSVTDIDFVVHKYVPVNTVTDPRGSRDVAYFMFVEVKTHARKMPFAQHDTLVQLDQMLRSTPRNKAEGRKTNGSGQFEKGHGYTGGVFRVHSPAAHRRVSAKFYGVHQLVLQKSTPLESEWMRWDNFGAITSEQLIQLVRFEVNPDTLQLMDHKRHKPRKLRLPSLPGLEAFDGRDG